MCSVEDVEMEFFFGFAFQHKCVNFSMFEENCNSFELQKISPTIPISARALNRIVFSIAYTYL